MAAISKSILKKILTASETQGGAEAVKARLNVLESLSSTKGGYKSKYLALNIMVEYLEPFSYLAEHPSIVRDVIESTVESVTSGKYVINFFEAFLKKALSRGNKDSEKRWFDIWIEEYLRALRSTNEDLRDAVCTLITPIVIKVNKNSLPLILSTLLSVGDYRQLSMQILEQVITLMKIARLNKMLVIDDGEYEVPSIRLEPKCQESLNQLRPDLPPFALPQSVLMKLVLSEDFKTALSCIEIVAAETKASLPVTKFELDLCTLFIKHGLRTTFPEFR